MAKLATSWRLRAHEPGSNNRVEPSRCRTRRERRRGVGRADTGPEVNELSRIRPRMGIQTGPSQIRESTDRRIVPPLPVLLGLMAALLGCPGPEPVQLPSDRLVVAVAELGAAQEKAPPDLKRLQRDFETLMNPSTEPGSVLDIRLLREAVAGEGAGAAEVAARSLMSEAPPGHVLLWGDVATTAGVPVYQLKLTRAPATAGGIGEVMGPDTTLALPALRAERLPGLPEFLEGLARIHLAQWGEGLEVYRALEGDQLRGALAPLLFSPRHLPEWNPDELTRAVSIAGEAAGVLAERDLSPTASALRTAHAQALLALGERLQGQACVEPLHNAGLIFSRVLEPLSPRENGRMWEENFMGLGNAMLRLGQRGEGEPSIRYLTAATVAYRRALSVQSKASEPDDWADAHFRQGLAYLGLGQRMTEEEAAEMLRQAISAFQRVLEVETRERAPQTWAATQANLGEVYYTLGTKASGTEAQQHYFSATLAFSQALEVYSRETTPLAWARTNENLGIAYASLGEKLNGPESVEHLSLSIAALQKVMEVVTKETDPALWAATQHNLARAYSALASRVGPGEGADYLRKAQSAYEQALTVFSRTSQARAWSTVEHNYGTCLLRLAEQTADGSAGDLLDRATKALRASLEVRRRESLPQDWAASQRALGDILMLRGRRTEEEAAEEHLRGAVEAYQLAREATRREVDVADYARLLLSLATAQSYLAEVTADRVEAGDLLDQGIWALGSAMGAISGQGLDQLEQTLRERMEAIQRQRRLETGMAPDAGDSVGEGLELQKEP